MSVTGKNAQIFLVYGAAKNRRTTTWSSHGGKKKSRFAIALASYRSMALT
jgi:hypothetical protein